MGKKIADKKEKLWAGRFTQKTSKAVEAFTESVSFDQRLWKYDIEGSIAHARMLGKQGIIPSKDAEAIVKALKGIAEDIGSGRFRFKEALEDVHMNIESALMERAGAAVGGRLHTARSRNDQIALDLRLYLRDEISGITGLLLRLINVLVEAANENIDVLMPGYTHLQRAQPVLLAHHLLAYVEMFDRDSQRLDDVLKRVDELPLGSCALAGTSLPIDRQYVARLLGFKKVSANSIDSVSDRDFVIEFMAASALIMMHLSRLAEEMVLWASREFSFIELPDAFATGSSIMPQKKNPDVAELVRGKTGRVYGALMGMLTIMKGLPLSYNRDMQEDKPLLFDVVDTLKGSLEVMAEMLPAIRFNKERLSGAAAGGYSTATDIAEYLVQKGLPFREAHAVTGRAVLYAVQKGKELAGLTLKELKGFSGLFEADVFGRLSAPASVGAKKSYGGTSKAEVKRQLRLREKKKGRK